MFDVVSSCGWRCGSTVSLYFVKAEQRKRERTKERNQANPSNERQSNTALKRWQELCSQKSKLLQELRVSDLLKQIIWSLLPVKQKGTGGGAGRFDKLQLREFQSEGENSAFSGQNIRLQKGKPNIQEKKTVEIVLLKNCGGGLDACANAFYSYGKDPFTQLLDRISECKDTNVKNMN